MRNDEDTLLAIKRLGGEGVLTEDDLPSLESQRRRVLNLMLDGRWHNAVHIRQVAGGSEGLRRLRELRQLPGVKIEKVRNGDTRLWSYRLIGR